MNIWYLTYGIRVHTRMRLPFCRESIAVGSKHAQFCNWAV